MISCQMLLLSTLLLICTDAKVHLNSSATSICPGDAVVFTCTTDTGALVWDVNGTNHVFYEAGQPSHLLDIFTLNLVSDTGMVFMSTATVNNVTLEDDKKVILCKDNNHTEKESEIKLTDIPSRPLDADLCFLSNGSSATISWVAPLDTPLCVDSYTVTVRNSSQVMVYNTTGNETSLNITNLTSDGEYSVTVAGRDGAGRLGQEIQVMKNLSIETKIVFLSDQHCGIFIQWNYTKMDFKHFLITHNVSSDQSPITTNRTNVTLYGVRPGETYTYIVNITVILFNTCTTYHDVSSIDTVVCEKENNTSDYQKKNCSGHVNVIKEDSSTMPLGYKVSIASSLLLGIIMMFYIVMCFCTSIYANTTSQTQSSSVISGLGDVHAACQQDKANFQEEKFSVQSGPNVNLPAYDYVRHQ